MAKKSNNDLLGEILEELESIRVDQEKNSNKGDNDSVIAKLFNGPVNDNEKKGSDKQTMTVLNSLKMIIDAVKGVSKVSTRDVDHVKNVVSSLSSVLNDIKFDKEQVESFQKFADTMQKLNAMMESLNGNLLKTIWKFNKVRGRILGKHVAGFYAAFFQAFEDAKVFTKISDMSKDSVDSFVKINEQITKLFSLNAKTIWLLGMAFEDFPTEAVNNITSFLTAILDTIAKYPDTKDFREKTDNFVAVMAAMVTVPFMQLWLMGKLLKPEAGEKIGNFFASLIKGLNEISNDNLKQATKLMIGISALLLSITASLLIVVFIATKFELKDIGLGFLIITGLVIMTVATMWALSLISFKEETGKVNAKDALMQAGAIALLLSTLTLSLMITVSVAKNNKLEDIALGIVMLAAVVGAMVGIMFVLASDKLQKGSKDAVATVGALVLMSIAILAMAGVLALIAKDPVSVFIGLGVSAAIIIVMSGLLWISSKLVDKGSKLIINGLIGIGAITLATIAITYAAKKYMDLMQQIKDLDATDIASGSGIVLGLLLSTTGIIFAASATLMGPQAIFFEAGMVAVAQIGGAILLISKASKSYIDLIKQIKEGNISAVDIELASKMLYGDDNSMVQFIKNTVKGLSDIGVQSAKDVRKINKNIQPLFTTIGKFMKIIENMASLRYVESYDPQTGNPKYGKMDQDAFTTAAKTLALGFNTFLNTLVRGENGKGMLSTETSKTINEICQNLCPKNSVAGFIFGGRKASVGDLLNVLGKFVGVIQQMANLKLPVYDENGNITGYDSYNQNAFTTAATNIASGFTAFISALSGIQNSGDIEDIIDDIADGDTLKLIKCLGSFVDIIKSMADMKYVERYENGKPIYRVMKLENWENAGKNIASGFSSFLTALHTQLQGKSGKIEDIIDDIGGKDTEALFTSIKTFTETIRSLNIDDNLRKNGDDVAKYFSDFLTTLYDNLNGKDREIKSIIKVLTSSGNGGIKELGSSIAAFYEATKGIQIDDTIAINIDTMISKFVAMEDNIKKFKKVEKTLSTSLSDFQKMAEIIKNTVQLDGHTNLTDMTLSLSNASSNIIEMISKINQCDIKAYNENIDMLKSGMSTLRKIMKISKTLLSDAYGIFSDSAGTIKKGISTIFEQFNNVVIKTPSIEAPSIDHDALQQVNVEVLNAKAMAFDGVALSIEKTNAQMARLVQLEKEWQKLSNESVFKNLAEMMKQQAEVLNEAVKSFTEQVEGESTIRVQISPADIAQGIEQASWQYSKSSNGNSYVKI